jgi:hypothetical protein
VARKTEKKNTEIANLPSPPESLFIGLGGHNLGNLRSYLEFDSQARATTSVSRVLVPFFREKRISTEVRSHTKIYLV